MGDAWKAALLLYLPITALVFMWFVALVYEARDRIDSEAERHFARLAFTAPLWPLGFVFIALRWLVRFWRLAFGGAR